MEKSKSIGNHSTGDYSTGHLSTGNHSTGHDSTGHYSTGGCSTGNHSTGDYSAGHYSTGNWSISNYSSGHFSTEDYSGFGCFDKPCTIKAWKGAYKPSFLFFKLTKWVEEENMTNEEKEAHPNYETTQGYLRVYDYKEAFQKSWDAADPADRIRIKELPNFCPKKFKEISGIDVEAVVEEMSLEEIEKALGKKIKIIE